MSTNSTYTPTAIRLHWLVALGLAGTFAVGLYMTELPLSPHKLRVYSWHKWAGVTIFLLVLARLGWRLAHPAPAAPAGMPRWQRRLADATHVALYVLMVAVPLTGWLMSSAKGYQTVWFGVLPLPDLVGKDKAMGDMLQGLHQAFNFTMAGLVLAHAGAAVKHLLIDRDGVLERMVPFLDKRPT